MDLIIKKLHEDLNYCEADIKRIVLKNDLNILNEFNSRFLKFVESMHDLLKHQSKEKCLPAGIVDIVLLCFTQIVTCVRYVDKSIKDKETGSANHFLRRIAFCLQRLQNILPLIALGKNREQCSYQEQNFVNLLDAVFDLLSQYTHDEINGAVVTTCDANAKQNIRQLINAALSHSLALANVALKEDKKALGALCKKVLRECNSFQEEDTKDNCHIKLKAMSLENALVQLEDHIKYVLTRLIFICFLDYEKFSTHKLRGVFRAFAVDDPTLDGFIADFDVNVDRTTQIGIFTIAFMPSLSIKNTLRSCLASMESLETCLMPSLQTINAHKHLGLLESHFNEEISIFKNTILNIIDSQPFVGCYAEILQNLISESMKTFKKPMFEDISDMGNFLLDHFLSSKLNGDVAQYYNAFVKILRECQAILTCVEKIDSGRIIKRFRIMLSVLWKLHESLGARDADDSSYAEIHAIQPCKLVDIDLFETAGITPSICNILYKSKEIPRKLQSSKTFEADVLFRQFPLTQLNNTSSHLSNNTNRYAPRNRRSFIKPSQVSKVDDENEYAYIDDIVDKMVNIRPMPLPTGN